MRKGLFIAPLLALSVAVAPACATKKFVRTEVGNTNARVDALTQAVEEIQSRVAQAETTIGQVDQKADVAATSATAARAVADNAANTANAATVAANDAAGRIEAVEAASRRLVYELALNEDEGNFRFGESDLSDRAKTHLDQIIAWLKANPKMAYIEIEGHTDNIGRDAVNDRLGLQRAEAARQYLHEQHQVPLHKINVMSYGAEKPLMPNTTREGRAMNRRIVVRVLS
ncbi:MAG: OmpA family protein [Acidobacteria bacterium]|nr:OmpA family protein [Acidobacteriota bacterium]